MGNELVPDGKYMRVDIPDLGIVAHWVFSEDGGKYLALNAQCGELGVSSQMQIKKIVDDPDTYPPDAIRQFRIETAGGRQVAQCLRKAEAAAWLTSIAPAKVKPELREKMVDVRMRVLMATDHIVWGDMSDVRYVATIQPHGGDVHLGGCPRCKSQLAVRLGPEGITLYLTGE